MEFPDVLTEFPVKQKITFTTSWLSVLSIAVGSEKKSCLSLLVISFRFNAEFFRCYPIGSTAYTKSCGQCKDHFFLDQSPLLFTSSQAAPRLTLQYWVSIQRLNWVRKIRSASKENPLWRLKLGTARTEYYLTKADLPSFFEQTKMISLLRAIFGVWS